ncbi:hypothetical protein NA78x_004487 [Anatilimnocola sp. NA78]|uniref:hypothetical protein n=1 Tax=Anatilimnocola sp. NA78 TaxID=3415683 RepID=UPI003CE4E2A9
MSLAVVVHLFAVVAVIAATWTDAADLFQAAMLLGFNLLITAGQILSVLTGHFTSKRNSVSRIRQPIEFWISYWIWIVVPLVASILLLLGYANKSD